MGLLADIVDLLRGLGLSDEEARAAADAAWGEINRMRAGGTATAQTTAAREAADADLPDGASER